jgi:pimeloyl-ACP methyl ester carboxylesterase
MNIATAGAGLRRSMKKLGDVELELFEGGRGQPLLFAHGSADVPPDAPFLNRLCEKFHVFAPSHPGFGGSNLPMWLDSVDDYAHLYLELIDTLGLKQVVVVGASIGGWAAAEMATKSTATIDKLVLVGPVGIKVGPVDRLDFPDLFTLSQDQINALMFAEPEKWRLDPDKFSDEQLLVIARNRQTFALITWEPYMHNPKLKHRLHRIDRPTLVLRGVQDAMVSDEYARAYARLIPGALYETIEGAAHSPHLEQPDRFVETVVRFVKS